VSIRKFVEQKLVEFQKGDERCNTIDIEKRKNNIEGGGVVEERWRTE